MVNADLSKGFQQLPHPLSNGLALGLSSLSAFPALNGPWEVGDGDDEERVAVRNSH